MSIQGNSIDRNIAFRTCTKNNLPAVNIYYNNSVYAVGTQIIDNLKPKDICELTINNEHTFEKFYFIVDYIIECAVTLRLINTLKIHHFGKDGIKTTLVEERSQGVMDEHRFEPVETGSIATVKTCDEPTNIVATSKKYCQYLSAQPQDVTTSKQLRKRQYEHPEEPIIYESYEKRQYKLPKTIKEPMTDPFPNIPDKYLIFPYHFETIEAQPEKIPEDFMSELDEECKKVLHSVGLNNKDINMLYNFNNLKI